MLLVLDKILLLCILSLLTFYKFKLKINSFCRLMEELLLQRGSKLQDYMEDYEQRERNLTLHLLLVMLMPFLLVRAYCSVHLYSIIFCFWLLYKLENDCYRKNFGGFWPCPWGIYYLMLKHT